jgi:ribosomal protein S18 acetylase RimI-like enzyme
MTIRHSKKEDFDLIKKMFLNEIGSDQQLATNFAEDLIYKLKTLLFIENNNVKGSISWNVKGGTEDGVIELVALGVNPESRRKGIATKLVNKLINETENYFSEHGYNLRLIFLYMEKNNEIGEFFYKSMNFQKSCEIPSFYPKGNAAIWTRFFKK